MLESGGFLPEVDAHAFGHHDCIEILWHDQATLVANLP